MFDASYYRQQAEDCRRVAANLQNQEEAEHFALLAAEYDVEAIATEVHAAVMKKQDRSNRKSARRAAA